MNKRLLFFQIFLGGLLMILSLSSFGKPTKAQAESAAVSPSDKTSAPAENNREERMFSVLRFLWITNGIVKAEELREDLAEALRDGIHHLVLEGSMESHNILIGLDERIFPGIKNLKIPSEKLPEDYFSRKGALQITTAGFIELNKEAQKQLIEKLGEGYDAFLALADSELSDPEIQNLIAEKLESEHPVIQEQALLLLEISKTSDPGIHKKMEKKLKTKDDLTLQMLALRALKKAANLSDPKILKSIAEQLNNEEIHIQVLALLTLGQHLKPSFDLEILKKMEKKLEDENSPVAQIAALLALGKIKPSYREIQEKKLEDKNLQFIAEAIALSAFEQISFMNPEIPESKSDNAPNPMSDSYGNPEGYMLIPKSKSDNAPNPMKGSYGNPEGYMLIPKSKSDDSDSREDRYKNLMYIYGAAIDEIAYFIFPEIEFSNPEISKLIAEKLENTNPIVRVIAILLLGDIQSSHPEIKQKIEKKLEDKSLIVQKTAKAVLQKISDYNQYR